jgi:hypothetical protein
MIADRIGASRSTSNMLIGKHITKGGDDYDWRASMKVPKMCAKMHGLAAE